LNSILSASESVVELQAEDCNGLPLAAIGGHPAEVDLRRSESRYLNADSGLYIRHHPVPGVTTPAGVGCGASQDSAAIDRSKSSSALKAETEACALLRWHDGSGDVRVVQAVNRFVLV